MSRLRTRSKEEVAEFLMNEDPETINILRVLIEDRADGDRSDCRGFLSLLDARIDAAAEQEIEADHSYGESGVA